MGPERAAQAEAKAAIPLIRQMGSEGAGGRWPGGRMDLAGPPQRLSRVLGQAALWKMGRAAALPVAGMWWVLLPSG